MWQYASLDITFFNDPPELLAKQILYLLSDC